MLSPDPLLGSLNLQAAVRMPASLPALLPRLVLRLFFGAKDINHVSFSRCEVMLGPT